MSYQPIKQGQQLSTDNSQTVTVTEASPGSPWVGTWERTRSLKIVRILTVLAATDPTIGGTFTFQFSEDGVTPTISEVRTIVDFTTVRDFDLINAGEWYRVQFEPAAPLAAESVFVTTTLRTEDDGAFVRLGDQELEEQNAALPATFAYLKGFRTTGKSIGITATRGGALLTATNAIEIARGNVPGNTAVNKFGRNPQVDIASTPEDVWLGGGVYTGQPESTTPDTVEVVSDDLDDSLLLSGGQILRIFGLRSTASTEYESEDINMGGVVAQTSSFSYYRLNRAYLVQAGNQGTNDGTITISHTGSGDVFASIAPGAGQTAVGAYTVPAGQTLFIQTLNVSMARSNGSAGSANVVVQMREFGQRAWRNIRNYEITDSFPARPRTVYPIELPALTDLRFRVVDVSDNGTVVNAEFDGVLVAD